MHLSATQQMLTQNKINVEFIKKNHDGEENNITIFQDPRIEKN